MKITQILLLELLLLPPLFGGCNSGRSRRSSSSSSSGSSSSSLAEDRLGARLAEAARVHARVAQQGAPLALEMQGRCRGDGREIQGKSTGDIGEM